RTQPTRWSRLEVTGYLSNFSNQVIVAGGSGIGGENNLADAGATNLYGVESAGLMSFDRIFSWSTIVELGARYTFSRATFRHGTTAGNLLPYAPQHTLSSNFDVEHPSGLGGQIAYNYVGPQFTDAENTVPENITGIVGEIGPRHI